MSVKNTLGRRRTIRLTPEMDRLLTLQARKKNKPISEIIRDSVHADLSADRLTAGEWIRTVADHSVRPSRPESLSFIERYRQRHE